MTAMPPGCLYVYNSNIMFRAKSHNTGDGLFNTSRAMLLQRWQQHDNLQHGTSHTHKEAVAQGQGVVTSGVIGGKH